MSCQERMDADEGDDQLIFCLNAAERKWKIEMLNHVKIYHAMTMEMIATQVATKSIEEIV